MFMWIASLFHAATAALLDAIFSLLIAYVDCVRDCIVSLLTCCFNAVLDVMYSVLDKLWQMLFLPLALLQRLDHVVALNVLNVRELARPTIHASCSNLDFYCNMYDDVRDTQVPFFVLRLIVCVVLTIAVTTFAMVIWHFYQYHSMQINKTKTEDELAATERALRAKETELCLLRQRFECAQQASTAQVKQLQDMVREIERDLLQVSSSLDREARQLRDEEHDGAVQRQFLGRLQEVTEQYDRRTNQEVMTTRCLQTERKCCLEMVCAAICFFAMRDVWGIVCSRMQAS